MDSQNVSNVTILGDPWSGLQKRVSDERAPPHLLPPRDPPTPAASQQGKQRERERERERDLEADELTD